MHFAQMNKILASLLGNDVFLDRLADKMIEKNLIAHVLDCENPQMVLGADQAPVITGLIDGVKEDVTQLYSDIHTELDYSAIKRITAGAYVKSVTYTADKDGIACAGRMNGYDNNSYQNVEIFLNINNNRIQEQSGYIFSGGNVSTSFIPVKKGDVITADSDDSAKYTTSWIKFIPY